MKRLPKISTLENKAKKLVNIYVFSRDKDICQWCGNHAGKSHQPSHVIPKSRSKLLRYDHMNIKTLCYGCHIPRWHKDPLLANEWFQDKFPDRWEYLQERRNKSLKDYRAERGITYREWLDGWIEYYEGKLK